MYQYLIYNTIIESDIKLYNLCQTKGNPDAYIRFDNIDFSRIPNKNKSFYYSASYVYMECEYAYYSISEGKEIIVQKKESSNSYSSLSEERLAAYILGWCFAFLFSQRGYCALHCTALNISNKGVIISGASGSGKSTTALTLLKRGYKYLADDIVMINPLESLNLIPAYPLQKVCREESNGIMPEKLLYIDEDRDKFSYLNIDQYSSTPLPLTDIFLLNKGNVDYVTITEHSGIEKYMKTLSCLFLSEIYVYEGLPDSDKLRMLKLASQVNVYTITRPIEGQTTDEIVDLIEKYTNK